MTVSYAGRMIPALDLPARLVLARMAAGLNQSELAKAIGVSRATVSLYERIDAEGMAASVKANIRRGTVMAWAMATGVDANWLMTGTGPPSDDGGPAIVRPKGFEPLTSWSELSPWSECSVVVPLKRVA